MNLRNRVYLIGNLISEPKITKFGNTKSARFIMETIDVYKKGEALVKDIQKHHIVATGDLVKTVEKDFSHNCELVIDGRLTRRTYLDTSGTTQYISEVIAITILCRNPDSKSPFAKKIA